MNIRNTLLRSLTGSAVLGFLFIGGIASAQTSFPQNGGMPPGIFGTVSATSGATLTIESRGFGQSSSAVTYTVDASSATVTKNNANASLSDIVVGDMVMIEGTVSGTSVAATAIHDVILKEMPQTQGQARGQKQAQNPALASSTLPIQKQRISPPATSSEINAQYEATGTMAAYPPSGQGADLGASTSLSLPRSASNQGFVNSVLGSIGSFLQRIFGWL